MSNIRAGFLSSSSTGWLVFLVFIFLTFPVEAEMRVPGVHETADRLAADSGGGAEVMINQSTGFAHMVLLVPGSIDLHGPTAKNRGLDFLDRYGPLFGIDDPQTQLVEMGMRSDRLARTHVRLGQRHRGVPVLGGEIRAHFDSAGRLEAINGVFHADVTVAAVPAVDGGWAAVLARAVVAKDHPLIDRRKWLVGDPSLRVYRADGMEEPSDRDHLVWMIEVSNTASVREHVLVDAHNGQVVHRIDGIHTLDRAVGEQNDHNTVWAEGDPLPYSGSGADADIDINTMIEAAGDIFTLVDNLSGGTFKSWDGTDGRMLGVYDPDPDEWDCTKDVNAYWNGERTAFCPGMAVDDVVAHEWGHAYTQGTHNLSSGYQIGALNESFSDILGEMVDILFGEDDNPNKVPRPPDSCSAGFGDHRPEVIVEDPEHVRGGYPAGTAEFNPAPPWTVTAQVELVDDGAEIRSDGCEPLVGFTPGRIALVDRGQCQFVEKARNAENAGAAGLLVVNNEGDEVRDMPGEGALSTPSFFIGQGDGEIFKSVLEEGLVATMSSAAESTPSVRWLIGESSALNGIRDMWNPPCLEDAGKVSDPEYWCRSSDDGGIHHNAGVPNHAFSLAVDGGWYNQMTVEPIGLVKAGHIYWRAMSVYQVPLTDFALHADAVQTSCRDLVGATLTDPVAGLPTDEVITAVDCDQVDTALEAVEARAIPNCPELRILEGDPPADTGLMVAFEDGFHDGLKAGWTVSNEGVYAEYEPLNWEWTDDLPEGGDGGAVYAFNSPVWGDCEPGSNDQSGVMHLTSPHIEIPDRTRTFLVFDHWVSTEEGYDGGNLKISVNDGPFEVIDGSSFRFNPYNQDLVDDGIGIQSNTNPMAGEPAFTGTEGGTLRGFWGQSQVRLLDLAGPGNKVRIRFDFGVDGCNGRVGWYVDNFRVTTDARTPRQSRRRPR